VKKRIKDPLDLPATKRDMKNMVKRVVSEIQKYTNRRMMADKVLPQ
jgi:hypothetical protein